LDAFHHALVPGACDRVVPEQSTALDRLAADEDDGGNAVPLEDGTSQCEDRTISVIEREQHRPSRQRRPTGERLAPIGQADRMTIFSDESTVRLEFTDTHVKRLECHGPGRRLVRANAVITQHRDAREDIAAEPAMVMPRHVESPFAQSAECAVHTAHEGLRQRIVINRGYLGSRTSNSAGVNSSTARPSIDDTTARQLP